MAWLKGRSSGEPAAIKGWVRRSAESGRFVDSTDKVVTRRDYPGQVTSRTIRNDVYEDALRAAETTLRNSAARKK
jgi:hypothetical protein